VRGRRGLWAWLLALAPAAAAQNNPYVQITTAPLLPAGYTGIAYSNFFRATTYNNLPASWSFASTQPSPLTGPPAGLSLNSSTGELAGMPTTAGTYSFAVQAQIAGSNTPAASGIFTITIAIPAVSITTASLPNAVLGTPYSATLTATSNAGPVTWSFTGNLAPGLTLSQNGQIAGVPTALGFYAFRALATIAGTGISTYQDLGISVEAGQLSILTLSLPVAYAGQAYSATVAASQAGASWGLSNSSILPAGIAFNTATGTFSGQTSATGAYPLTVQATLANYAPATQSLTLYVANGTLGIAQTSIPVAIAGTQYQTTLTATGGLAPYTWSLASGTNAPWLSINASTGALGGTPTAVGTFTVAAQVSDATNAPPLARVFTLTVAAPLSVSTGSLAPGAPSAPYSQTLTASGGQAPFTWSLGPNSPPLPPGLTLSTSGVISGTIAFNATGVYAFVAQVTDAGGRVASKTLSIAIGATVTITTGSLPDGVVGASYSQMLSASGGTSPYSWSIVSGQLPAGLALAKTGQISGTPTAAGASTFTVQAADSTPGGALTAQLALTLSVDAPLSIGTASALPPATAGMQYSATLQATGGRGSYAWSIVSGALPAGLTLMASSGAIAGIPPEAGSSTFTAAVADSGGQSAQKQFSITVSPSQAAPLQITTGNLSATVGVAFSQTLAASGGAPPYAFALTGGTLPAGLTFNAGTATISGTATAAGLSNVSFTATDSSGQTASKTITITASAASAPTATVTIGSGAAVVGAAQQVPVNISLSGAFPADITVSLALTFQSSVGGDDQTVQFITSGGGSRNVSLTIPAGSLAPATAPVLATGTVAGTITIATQLSSPGTTFPPPAAAAATIAKGVPVIESVAFSNTGGGLTVTVIGYSTTRDMASGDFTFSPAMGSTLAQSDIQAQLGPAFSAWYQNASSSAFGSQFKLTMPFTVSGNPADVISVAVKLTNSAGTSPPASPQ